MIGLFAGSFDPITLGHINIINRINNLCDKTYVVIAHNPAKKYKFDLEKRRELVIKCLFDYKVNIISYDGAIVDCAKNLGVNVMFKGIRDSKDFEYESNMAKINKLLEPSIETIFLNADDNLSLISSSMVKELKSLGKDVSKFVPKHVNEVL